MYIGWLNIGCVFAHHFWVACEPVFVECCVTDRQLWLEHHIKVSFESVFVTLCDWSPILACASHHSGLCDWSPNLACASLQSGLCAGRCYVVWLIADSGLRVTSEWPVCLWVLCCVTDRRFWLARHFRVVCVPVGAMLCDWSRSWLEHHIRVACVPMDLCCVTERRLCLGCHIMVDNGPIVVRCGWDPHRLVYENIWNSSESNSCTRWLKKEL